MMILMLLMWLIFPIAFLIGLVEILVVQARNRGRNPAAWAMLGCAACLLAGGAGYFVAPAVVDAIKPDPQKTHRVFVLSIAVPAVAAAAVVGGLLKWLPLVAKTTKSPFGSPVSMKAEDWHTREQCKQCGYFFDVGDQMCQCPMCGVSYHLRCWNDAAGCGSCAATSQSPEFSS